MKAIVCEQWGDPEHVLKVRDDVPEPEPGPGEVRVRMLASPINPSDLLTVRGQYGKQPPLPMTPGFEGVGVVEAGSGLLAWRVRGRRVAVLNGSSQRGNWQEYVVIPARQAVPVSSALSDEQAASFFVNPATALIMTRYLLRVPRGAWLLQTAAGSALGRMVIRLGNYYGFRTLNVVRRREQADELLRRGASAAIATNEEPLIEGVKRVAGREPIRYGIDAVGGSTAVEAIRAMSRGGRMLLYGTLSDEPMALGSRDLMGGQKIVEGFWLSEWVRDQGVLTMLRLFRRLNKLIGAGVLATEPGASFPLDRIGDAVREAMKAGRKGKVLLRIASKSGPI
jgi:NADPH:quinone reductase-like Zn-dependent oxidoreductase